MNDYYYDKVLEEQEREDPEDDEPVCKGVCFECIGWSECEFNY